MYEKEKIHYRTGWYIERKRFQKYITEWHSERKSTTIKTKKRRILKLYYAFHWNPFLIFVLVEQPEQPRIQHLLLVEQRTLFVEQRLLVVEQRLLVVE
jgi:hypothetical protein